MASWYGAKFHGRTTASGEPYDMNAMTAAHPSLPFGTKVRVTNLENGRAVVLRINDRGPVAKGFTTVPRMWRSTTSSSSAGILASPTLAS